MIGQRLTHDSCSSDGVEPVHDIQAILLHVPRANPQVLVESRSKLQGDVAVQACFSPTCAV